MFRSKRFALIISLTSLGLLTPVMTFWKMRGSIWKSWDLQILEVFHNAAFVNRHGVLVEHFPQAWSLKDFFGVLVLLTMILTLAAMLKRTWVFYIVCVIMTCLCIALTWLGYGEPSYFPLASLGGSLVFIFFGLVVARHVTIAKEQAFIRKLFAKRAPRRALAQLLATPELCRLEGEEKILSVMFTDVSAFAALTEQMPPNKLKRLLNDYFTEMSDIIIASGGRIDKFMGGAFVAEFGMFMQNENHAAQAVRAALQMQRRLLDLHQQWTRLGLPCLQCRIGINTGRVLVGNMGAREIVDYTVLGEAVQFAANLERLNKMYGTTLLVSESTHAHLSPEEFRTRMLDKVKARPVAEAIMIYEVHGDLATFRSTRPMEYYQIYQKAFEAYLQRDFALAREYCREALSVIPDDSAATLLKRRITQFMSYDVPIDWNGAVLLSDLYAASLSA